MRSWSVALLLVVGCDDFEPNPNVNPPVDTGTAGCPGEMVKAGQATLAVTNMAETGTPLTVDFDNGAVYEGYEPACIAPDLSSFVFVFEVGGMPYGAIDVAHPGVGSYTLADGEATVSIDLFGADPPVSYSTDQWQSGSLSIQSDDGLIEAALFGLGYLEARSLNIDAQLTIAP